MKKSYHNLVEAYSVLNRPVRLSRRHPFLVGDEAPSGCTAPSRCVLRPNAAGHSDYFSPCGTPCSPLSPSDTVAYYMSDPDLNTTFTATYSDTSGFTFRSTSPYGVPWGPKATTTKWQSYPLEWVDENADSAAYIYFRQVPGDDGTTKGEWFIDAWNLGTQYTSSCLCPKPDELYPANASSASGTISKCECKCYQYSYRYSDYIDYDSFLMTFDGTYFSLFSWNDVSSFDTDQTNIVFGHNKFTIKINKNDATASYEITPNS